MWSLRTLKLIAASLFGLIFLPLANEFVIELARRRGFFNDPEQAARGAWTTAQSALSAIAAQPWYPYLVGFAAGLAASAGLMWLRQRDGARAGARRDQEAAQTAQLANDVWKACTRLRTYLASLEPRDDWVRRVRTDRQARSELSTETAAFVRSVLVSLRERGIPTPEVGEHIRAEDARRLADFLASIHPFLARGQRVELIREAARFSPAKTDPQEGRLSFAKWYAAEVERRRGR